MLRPANPARSGGVAVPPGIRTRRPSLPPSRNSSSAGNLKYIKGNRLEDADLAPGGGPRVWGRTDFSPIARRTATSVSWISRRRSFGPARRAGRRRLLYQPRPGGMVDVDGGSAVIFPARICESRR